MTLSIAGVVSFIAHHAAWAFPVMFVTAFGESFVFISLLFPGTSIMIAAGLLIPDGTLPLFPVLAGAILGATIGDTISWGLGARYGDQLTRRWPLSRYPELIGRGEAFFERFGTLSVFVGQVLRAAEGHYPSRRRDAENAGPAVLDRQHRLGVHLGARPPHSRLGCRVVVPGFGHSSG